MIENIIIILVRIVTGAIVYTRGFSFEPTKQRIYYANHSSHLDTVLLWSLVPKNQRAHVHPAAAKDYWWTSPFRTYLAEKIFHAVPVIRQREAIHEDPIGLLQETLGRGESLIIFPEGTRGNGANIQAFKGGIYHLARDHPNAELVPIHINNLNRVLPKGHFLPVPILCTVTFGTPTRLLPNETKPEFLNRTRLILEELAS